MKYCYIECHIKLLTYDGHRIEIYYGSIISNTLSLTEFKGVTHDVAHTRPVTFTDVFKL
jgi:hypothetical protein